MSAHYNSRGTSVLNEERFMRQMFFIIHIISISTLSWFVLLNSFYCFLYLVRLKAQNFVDLIFSYYSKYLFIYIDKH